ncbi:MAG: nucleotidyltransferase family protein [Faecalibacterium sp.]
MKIAGIIAEYDPFHNGHAWQLAAARAAGAQCIVVCLSTAATQRGALPLLSEEARVRAAIGAGADIVLSMPAVYAASGAEQFARAGVAILAAAGCDTLIFGAETPKVEQLMGCARALCSPEYEAALGAAMTQGARNFASARQCVMQQLYPEAGYGNMLSNPNDNLAIEYCKAIVQQSAPLTPYALPRVGAGHGQSLAVTAGQYASGSALRKLWENGGVAAIRPYVPTAAYPLYAAAEGAGCYTDWAKVDIALLSRLRADVPHGFAAVRGVSEGLEYRLADAVKTAITADGLYDALTTVRYPRARMRRLCLDAAMRVGGVGAPGGYIQVPPLPPYLHILGGRKEMLGILKGARLPVSASLAVLKEKSVQAESVAHSQTVFGDFSSLCMAKPAPMSTSYTKKIVIF